VDNDRYTTRISARDFCPVESGPSPANILWEIAHRRGRPGGHIGVSANGHQIPGAKRLDIHTRRIDLAFPHHENEIAQVKAATGKPFVALPHWLHAEHLLVERRENVPSRWGKLLHGLREPVRQRVQALRAWQLCPGQRALNRRQLNFTFDGLQQATSSVERLRNFARA